MVKQATDPMDAELDAAFKARQEEDDRIYNADAWKPEKVGSTLVGLVETDSLVTVQRSKGPEEVRVLTIRPKDEPDAYVALWASASLAREMERLGDSLRVGVMVAVRYFGEEPVKNNKAFKVKVYRMLIVT